MTISSTGEHKEVFGMAYYSTILSMASAVYTVDSVRIFPNIEHPDDLLYPKLSMHYCIPQCNALNFQLDLPFPVWSLN